MTCEYCIYFQSAKWRISPDPEDFPGKKFKPKLRHCGPAQKYLSGGGKICSHFNPGNKFWCQKNDQWIFLDACFYKKNKVLEENCEKCSQYQTIVNVQRAKVFFDRKQKQLEIEESKPTSRFIKRGGSNGIQK
jgi:hypothetical protein